MVASLLRITGMPVSSPRSGEAKDETTDQGEPRSQAIRSYGNVNGLRVPHQTSYMGYECGPAHAMAIQLFAYMSRSFPFRQRSGPAGDLGLALAAAIARTAEP
jgi:hypothetical protein